MDDAAWMELALAQAKAAMAAGEVPVGAVLVNAEGLLAADHNRRESLRDPTAHAELLVIRRAAELLGAWRLVGTTLYVTLEPCAMCTGAMVLARIDQVVYGAADPKGGAIHSVFHLADDPRLNHRLRVVAGVEAAASTRLLRQFFRARRG